ALDHLPQTMHVVAQGTIKKHWPGTRPQAADKQWYQEPVRTADNASDWATSTTTRRPSRSVKAVLWEGFQTRHSRRLTIDVAWECRARDGRVATTVSANCRLTHPETILCSPVSLLEYSKPRAFRQVGTGSPSQHNRRVSTSLQHRTGSASVLESTEGLMFS